MSACVFCEKVLDGSADLSSPGVYSFTPLNPVTDGHRLFVAVDHYARPHDNSSITGMIFAAVAQYAGMYGGDYNLIINAGDAASQTVQHVHVHFVPRRKGDGLKLPWTKEAQS